MKTILAVLLVVAGCGGENGNPKQDAGLKDAGTGTPDASCFTNPQTHYEIINACTTAQQIFKDTKPPLLNDDGSLPALPP